jgi:hypothetical protein
MGGKVVGERGFWFPLVLLGFGLLALLGWNSTRPFRDIGWIAYQPLPATSGYVVGGGGVATAYVGLSQSGLGLAPVRDRAWVVLVTVTLVATMAWYGWRARRAGDSAGTYVALAVGGGIAVPVGYVAAAVTDAAADPAGLVTPVALPLVALGGLALVWARVRLGPRWRVVVVAVGVACLLVGLATMLGAWAPGLFLPVVIAGGLLALARFERSRLLALVAVAVLAALLVFPLGTLSTLVPAVIVLAAAVVSLARRPVAPAAPA